MATSRILARIREGRPARLASLWTVPHWKIVEMMALAGFDGVWIEMEHSDFTWEQMSQAILAARAHGMDAMVRVPRRGYTDIIRPLEAGAAGVLVPQITSVAEAREFTRMARFAPLGWRGIGGSVDTHYGRISLPEYVENAQQETFCALMIERREVVEEIETIAAIEGMDGVFVGPVDLSQSYNILGQTGHSLIEAAIERVAAACAARGKWWGTLASTPEAIRRRFAQGARFFMLGGEVEALTSGFRAALDRFEGIGP
ncbi:MAG: host specificity protein [Armatimonadetes bacterium]|nr:host specificity protein [Armatimonadota bacterium]